MAEQKGNDNTNRDENHVDPEVTLRAVRPGWKSPQERAAEAEAERKRGE